MPTGYTCIVDDGCSFEEYTWRCARAFGALIDMRDEPTDTEIPERLSGADSYYSKQLESSKARLVELESSSPEAVAILAKAEYSAAVERYKKEMTRSLEITERQMAMRALAESWEPPTTEHTGLKEFMLSQLEVGKETTHEYLKPPDELSPSEWLAVQLSKLRHDVEYYSKQLEEENRRHKGRQKWVDDLRSSVPQPRKSTP